MCAWRGIRVNRKIKPPAVGTGVLSVSLRRATGGGSDRLYLILAAESLLARGAVAVHRSGAEAAFFQPAH